MFDVLLSKIQEFVQNIIVLVPAVIVALTFHEFAHSFVSYKLGDPTAKEEGRLTLNPLKHIDPLGFVFLMIFHFGWAKPVPVRMQWYKNPKRDMAITAIAGPASNIMLAFFTVPFYAISALISDIILPNNIIADYFSSFFYYLIILNIGLAVFNLIPIPPLDGSRLLLWILPDKYYYYIMRFEQYGFIVLFVLVMTNILDLSGIIFYIAEPFIRLTEVLANYLYSILYGAGII